MQPKDLPKRKSPRIPGYNYDTPNYYFITICTHNKECIFGGPGKLNKYGEIAKVYLEKMPSLYPTIHLDKYVIMPNHVHMIMIVQAENGEQVNRDMLTAIGQYKMAVTKYIRQDDCDRKVWQRSFHDHIIRNQQGYEKIWMYIENNPQKWEDDCFYLRNSNE